MTISLEKKLEEVTVAKKRYRSLFVTALVLLVILFGVIYNNTVLDYAVLDNVKINRVNETNEVIFSFDVVKSGRVDFNYGEAVLTDRKQIEQGEGFNWTWGAKGETDVSIRSRKLIFPHWDKDKFIF